MAEEVEELRRDKQDAGAELIEQLCAALYLAAAPPEAGSGAAAAAAAAASEADPGTPAPPDNLCCPITQALMQDPVILVARYVCCLFVCIRNDCWYL